MKAGSENHEAVVVVGAGAIGGLIGAHLARADVPVTLVETRDDHRETMREHGVRVGGIHQFVSRPQVVAPAELAGPIKTALVAVKCPQTEDALTMIAERLTDDAVVVSLQNGFEVYRLAARLGAQRSVGGLVTLSGYVDEPGSIIQSSPGGFSIGYLDGRRTGQLEEVARLLGCVCPVELTTDIRRALWSKAAIGAVWFATALVDEDVVRILSQKRYLGMLGALAAEVAQTAELEGVECGPIDGFDPAAFLPGAGDAARAEAWRRHIEFWGSIMQSRTGVWRDLAVHHRPTEVDCILSPVTAFAARRGRTLVRLERLIGLIREVEDGARALDWGNLDDLLGRHERAEADEAA